MSLQIASPFQQFFDRDGSPLDSGFVYVGTVNLNPETNPLTVYFDDALTIPAAQPLRTSNGYIVRNGSPARIYTSQEDFSLTVRDKRNVLVFTVADATSLSNLQTQLASGSGSSLVGYNQGGAGAVDRTVQSRLRDYVSVRDFGAVGDGVANDTAAIQAAIDAISAAGGGNILIPAGTYMVSTIVPKDYVSLYGEGKDVTYLKQIVGTNATMIVSGADLRGFRAFDFSTDGNYFQGDWNANPGILGNTSGGGIDIKPIACEIDIAINNHAGIGCLIRNATVFPPSAEYNVQTVISVEGKDFGKEGLIIAGMPDGIVKKAFLGRCGILPRPTADTQLAVSDYYPGDPVDGIVVDGRNIEFELVHVYACWSGAGFRTRNTVRLTGMEIISESNLQQVNLSTGTYGSAKFDGRRFGLVHPNWSAPLPVYDPAKHDAFYIQAESGFKAAITAHALIVPIERIAGANIVNITGDDNNVEVSYRGTSPVDPLDPDYPGRYKHTVLKTSSGARGNLANVTAANARGLPIVLDEGDGNSITASLDVPVGGGVAAAGTNSSINATVFGQLQDGGLGSAFENTGSNNTWVIAGGSNADDYASSGSPGRTTVFGSDTSIREIDIASGVLPLTVFDRVVSVRAEGGAGTDDLDNITGCATDQVVYLRGRNSQTITLNKNAGGTGNIRLNISTATRVLNSANDFIQMIADGTNVIEVAYADNG
jgi:hypothetical protein